jgi:Protein of unknown function (DUF3592)
MWTTLRIAFGAFALIGLIFLAAGIGIFLHTRQFVATALSTSALVTENVYRERHSSSSGTSWAFYPRVHFRTADGQEITMITNSGSSPPSYYVGEAVTILYDPRQPYRAEIRSFGDLWTSPLVFSGLGLIFLSIGAGPAIWWGLSARKNAWLQENGQRITAQITHVGLDTSLSVGGQHPYRISCQWLDPEANQMHLFKSRSIWFDPAKYIHGRTVEVLVDRKNPHRYVVVTDFLPKEV